MSAIAAAHRAKELQFDTKHPALRRALSGILRKHGSRQDGAAALRTADIAEICGGLGLDAHSVRNRAIILLGFAGGFRRSEVVGLDIEHLRFRSEGLEVLLERSKTDQHREGRLVGILPGTVTDTCPVNAVKAWIRLAELEGEIGPLFRPVNRWGAIEFARLSDKAVDRIVKALCRAAGLEKNRYSAHSLRAGHVTEAKARGVDNLSIKRQTGHASDQMVDRYAREANIFASNSSARLGL